MICYLDTSALVKLYIKENGSEEVLKVVEASSLVATSKIAYAEARAAFARGLREKVYNVEAYRLIVDAFRNDWNSYFAIEVSDDILEMAGDAAEKFALCGFDALHLASASFLTKHNKEEMMVGCWDVRLWQAYCKAGFSVFPPQSPRET